MTKRMQQFMLPLLSTIFFLSMLLALRTAYEPAGSVTPVAPASSISEPAPSLATVLAQSQ